MSASSGLASPPVVTDGRPTGGLLAFSVPGRTLRLLARCGTALVAWFCAGQIARFALLYAADEVSRGSAGGLRLVATMLLLTLMAAAALVVTVGMLHTLRGASAEVVARRAEGGGDERFPRALDRAAPLFAVIYLCWSPTHGYAQDFIAFDGTRLAGEASDTAFTATASATGRGLAGLDIRVSVGLMVAAWAVRLVYGRLYESGRGRLSGLVAAFAELSFFLFGVNAVLVLVGSRSDWLAHRSVVVAAGEMTDRAARAIPGWEAFWGWAGETWPYAVEALVLPLMWLVVAISVYGAGDTRAALRGAGADAAPFDRKHGTARASLAGIADGLRKRWTAIGNALRLVASGGAPLFGLFCLSYVGLRIAAQYGERGLRHLIGSREPYQWLVLGEPVTLVSQLALTVLTMCLLAATFDVASARARRLDG